MTESIKRLTTTALAGWWFLMMVPTSAHALLPYKASAEELRALPYYCRTKKPPFPAHALHQYCDGIKQLNRGRLPLLKSRERSYYLDDAISKFKRVIDHAKDRNKLRKYDMYLGLTYRYQADAYRRQDQVVAAIKAYREAIKYHPKGLRAYAELSRLLAKHGLKEDARGVLKEGLEAAPDSKGLQQMLEQL